MIFQTEAPLVNVSRWGVHLLNSTQRAKMVDVLYTPRWE